MQLVAQLHAPHFPPFAPWDRTEESVPNISSPIFAKGGAFWSCGHLPSFSCKYQVLYHITNLRSPLPVEMKYAPP